MYRSDLGKRSSHRSERNRSNDRSLKSQMASRLSEDAASLRVSPLESLSDVFQGTGEQPNSGKAMCLIKFEPPKG